MSWQAVNEGLGDHYLCISDLAVAGEYLYAGTAAAAVWRRPLVELIPTSLAETPVGRTDYSITPHPLALSSVIALGNGYSLRNAVLSLSTVTGRTVRTTTGLYGSSVRIDRAGLAPGVYIFSLSENGSRITAGTIVVE